MNAGRQTTITSESRESHRDKEQRRRSGADLGRVQDHLGVNRSNPW